MSMGAIRVGTTSWTEASLIKSGQFYPPGVDSAEARLRYYSSRFPVVEVDSTYYGLPSERNAVLWTRRTEAGFVFDVKAFRLFTHHQTPPQFLPRDIREEIAPIGKKNLYYRDLPAEVIDELWYRFHSALKPLRLSGKLGAVLFQFAPWFVYGKESLAFLAELKEHLPGLRIAVEFRNNSWLNRKHESETLALEHLHGLVHVVVDEPQGFAASVPAVWSITSSELAMVRLHGRNAITWQKRGLITAAERFDYLYSRTELESFVVPVRKLAERAAEVHVLFNNCYRDNAQRNAATMRSLLEV